MDEDLAIINNNTRNQKIKDFFNKNKKLLILIFGFLLIIIISFYSFQIYQDKKKEPLSKKFNNEKLNIKNGKSLKILSKM